MILMENKNPDLNPEDKTAGQKFSEINEANEVLSDTNLSILLPTLELLSIPTRSWQGFIQRRKSRSISEHIKVPLLSL